jgi:hypothetical protein
MVSRHDSRFAHRDHEPGSFCIAGFPTGQRADWKVGVTRECRFMGSLLLVIGRKFVGPDPFRPWMALF